MMKKKNVFVIIFGIMFSWGIVLAILGTPQGILLSLISGYFLIREVMGRKKTQGVKRE